MLDEYFEDGAVWMDVNIFKVWNVEKSKKRGANLWGDWVKSNVDVYASSVVFNW